MNIIITTPDGAFYSVEVTLDLEVENLIALASMESKIPPDRIHLSVNGVPLIDKKKTLQHYKVNDGDMVLMTQVTPQQQQQQQQRPKLPKIDWGAIKVPQSALGSSSNSNVARQQPPDQAETFRQELLANPSQLAVFRERDPKLADATKSKEDFARVFKERQEMMRKKREEERFLLTGNPMDPEYQKKLYDMLQGKQIEENLEQAMEEHPESFGQVVMLYINCEINGHKVKAFVDSGAQMTLISSVCAERCNISRLIDKRFQGLAKGVGTQKILGRVHLLPLKIGNDFFPCTFSVLDNQPMEMLLGLDMLKRHQCVIDLKENVLKIGTTSTSAPFLAEHDIPKPNEDADLQSEASTSSSSTQGNYESTSGGSVMSGVTNTENAILNDNIKKLVAMGVSPDAAKRALLECGNNPELAISMLFEK